jgi:polysaccharide export outer membrane protein
MRTIYSQKKAFFRFLSLSVLGILAASLAQAQVRRDTLRTGAPPADRTPLETAVDSNEYVVGPGDELTIGLWGAVNQILTVPVTPEGTALIPSVEEARVGGLTLAQAKKEIRAVVERRYPLLEASVTLTKIRDVKVRVSGGVAVPGIYALSAYSRASEAIAKAGGLAGNASRRNIELVRQSGEKNPVDLLRFERTGEGESNPRVVEGDRLVVPFRSSPWGDILVAGEVNAGGVFEPRSDDSLKTLLAVAGGLSAGADSAKLERVWKNPAGQTEREMIDLRQLNTRNLAVRPGDQVFIRPLPGLVPKTYVSVRGEVAFPGYYDVEEGKARLSEVIARAGGFTPRAILSSAYIIRGGYFNPLLGSGDSVNPALIEKMNQEDLDFYLEKSRWKGAVVASDFVGLFVRKDGSKDVLLYSGDEITVPQTSGSIYVIGRVIRPGLFSFEEKKRLGDYIGRAGGYSAGADRGKVKILKAVSGAWIKGHSGVYVDAGDIVLVPNRKGHFWSNLKDVVVVASNAAALIIVVRKATQ